MGHLAQMPDRLLFFFSRHLVSLFYVISLHQFLNPSSASVRMWHVGPSPCVHLRARLTTFGPSVLSHISTGHVHPSLLDLWWKWWHTCRYRQNWDSLTTARELPTCTFTGPGASNTTKIPREDPQRERKKKSENVGGRGEKKKREILGPPASGSPLGLHFFWVWAPAFLIFIMLLICPFFVHF